MANRATTRRGKQETPYQRARDAGREALRAAVLPTAGDMLAREGPGALTMRRIADQIGSSTTVLYAVFDGKNGIIDAMVREGHNLLRQRLEAIAPSEDAFARLAATAVAYRETALADPARYQLMFGNAIPGYLPSEAAREAARSSFDALVAAVRDCIDAGVFKESTDDRFAAEILVAAAHGAVSLELSGHFDDPARSDERFAVVTSASVQPFLAATD
jgi:AcrR family transcriptional regulator